MGELLIANVQSLDVAIEAWMRSKGVKLVSISPGECAAARRTDPMSVRDMADFIEAEGFALEDAFGERTLVSDTNFKGNSSC